MAGNLLHLRSSKSWAWFWKRSPDLLWLVSLCVWSLSSGLLPWSHATLRLPVWNLNVAHGMPCTFDGMLLTCQCTIDSSLANIHPVPPFSVLKLHDVASCCMTLHNIWHSCMTSDDVRWLLHPADPAEPEAARGTVRLPAPSTGLSTSVSSWIGVTASRRPGAARHVRTAQWHSCGIAVA